jgi:predicted RNase H-like nuclease
MKSKIVKRTKKETNVIPVIPKLTAEETIIELQKILITKDDQILSKDFQILELLRQISDLQTEHSKKKGKSPTTKKSVVAQPFDVTLRGLDDKHDIIYSSENE